MTDYLNLSFETGDATVRKNVVGDSLLANEWVSIGIGAAVQYVDFGELGEVAEPAERFETEWTGLSEFTFDFLPGFVDLEPFIFNTGSDVDITETFDFWDPAFIFELSRLARVKFNGDTLDNETFEVGWSNETAIFTFASVNLEKGDFTNDELTAESFEEDWKIDTYKEEFVDADLEAALFEAETNPPGLAFENFEKASNELFFITIVEAIQGETYTVTINQRELSIVCGTLDEILFRNQIVDMINNSPEPVTASQSGTTGNLLVRDDVLPATSILGVDGPPTGSGPSIVKTDVIDLGLWSQTGLIEGFVDL